MYIYIYMCVYICIHMCVCVCVCVCIHVGFPGSSDGKGSAYQCRRCGFSP